MRVLGKLHWLVLIIILARLLWLSWEGRRVGRAP